MRCLDCPKHTAEVNGDPRMINLNVEFRGEALVVMAVVAGHRVCEGCPTEVKEITLDLDQATIPLERFENWGLLSADLQKDIINGLATVSITAGAVEDSEDVAATGGTKTEKRRITTTLHYTLEINLPEATVQAATDYVVATRLEEAAKLRSDVVEGASMKGVVSDTPTVEVSVEPFTLIYKGSLTYYTEAGDPKEAV